MPSHDQLSLLQPEFWQHEDGLLWDSLLDLIFDTMLQGMSSAVPLLPDAIRPLINWDLANEAALLYLREYRLKWVNNISDYTRQKIMDEMYQIMLEGENVHELTKRLKPLLFSDQRAGAIAATEVTRIYAQGNLNMWQSTGVVGGKKWMTARDERVCPFCGPLHGRTVAIDDNFALDADTLADSPQMKALLGRRYNRDAALRKARGMLRSTGDRAPHPPYHVRCRCWLQPFVSIELLEERIGEILAGEFFAQVKSGVIKGVAVD